MFATILITLVVIGGVVLALHTFPIERGTPTGATAPAANQHGISPMGWVVSVVLAIIILGVGSHPRTHPAFKAFWDWAYSGSVTTTSASASASATATATTGSLDASPEGIRLMEKHYGTLTKNGRTIEKFPAIGDGWEWYVLDASVSATVGQKVVGGQHKVTDASVTSVTIYIARQVGGVWEFGDPRQFSL
ncbi:hypothetical protein COU78_04025 [Candidatus Peregrinibacteria bacterium CG10_big_fil_rev_8_21_14_0_10_49_24]|nr:MAG: hypothetical protein COV83_01375 [Candidatus Peregrinibacteria bacterium CG11_big_fil_rev_8_21_14_0_20_49_14]PIR50904.1 MAG: hypothetical protein COU78_04025 [Candidatus Peregrinibacteria bacterium CG10_big_fil_rev_8_21_14_0_10_49_24]PJA67721.1 MAG: hypothetical protein CO157_03125 [Candidatus Peregrinibacteria bacterium CG_4_9_14_3_um_filter_49_12]